MICKKKIAGFSVDKCLHSGYTETDTPQRGNCERKNDYGKLAHHEI